MGNGYIGIVSIIVKSHRFDDLAPASHSFRLCNQRLLHSLRFRFGHNGGHRQFRIKTHRLDASLRLSHCSWGYFARKCFRIRCRIFCSIILRRLSIAQGKQVCLYALASLCSCEICFANFYVTVVVLSSNLIDLTI